VFNSEPSPSKFETKEEPAGASNENGAGAPQAPAPTDAAEEDYITPDVVILAKHLRGGPAPVFAGLDIEPLGAGICEPDEGDHGGQAAQYDTRARDDIAAPPAQSQPALDAGVAAPEQHLEAEQQVAESELYLDRSIDPERLSIPLAFFPGLYKVIPTCETTCAGWSAFIDAIAPTLAPVVVEKKDVPYVIAGTLQEAPLSKAAQEELQRAGTDAEIGKARSNKHVASLGPAFLLDDDIVDGDVFDREIRLKTLGVASFIYSSHSYGFGKMGGRVGVCLNRQYTPDEHQLLWDGINHLLGGGFDKAGRTLSQCYGMHARRSTDALHRRVVIEGAALNVDALVALGRSLQPAKKAPAAAARLGNRPDHAATIEQIRSAVKFLSGHLDEHREVLADEPEWMNKIARPFAHQAWRCPDQREELQRLLDELSQKAPGYDREENEQRFERYIAEAPERAGGAGPGGPRTIASFFAWVKEVGWDGATDPTALCTPPITFSCYPASYPALAAHFSSVSEYLIAEMNRRYSAGFIGGKFRVARFDHHPKYPLQRLVEFSSKEDFLNGVINPRVEVPKFNKDGEPDGTKTMPRGKYWFESPERSEFDAVTFRPGAPPLIEKEQDGRLNKTLNTYAGFSVVPDHVDSASKCSHYLAHVHDNIADGGEELCNYIFDWMASGVAFSCWVTAGCLVSIFCTRPIASTSPGSSMPTKQRRV
jgi:hypothetical protein